jgi:hypothetical protein
MALNRDTGLASDTGLDQAPSHPSAGIDRGDGPELNDESVAPSRPRLKPANNSCTNSARPKTNRRAFAAAADSPATNVAATQ